MGVNNVLDYLPNKSIMLKAMKNSDSNFDGFFYTCVTTTKIYCNPSCKSKKPLDKNVQFAKTINIAKSSGFRPCKKCYPDILSIKLIDHLENRSIILRPIKDFDYYKCLDFFKGRSLECLDVIQNTNITKLIVVNGNSILIKIYPVLKNQIGIHILGKRVTKKDKLLIAQYVIEWFDLERNLNNFFRKSATDKILKNITKNYRGLRIIGIPDLFEALCWAIIGQQVNLTFAYSIKKQFIESYGGRIIYKGEKFYTFPQPSKVAKATTDHLRNLQFSYRKAEYIIDLAKSFVEGKLNKLILRELEEKTLMQEKLISFRGIGPWTADYALMKSLGQSTAFPIADVGLHNAIKKQLGLSNKPSIEKIKKLAKNWSGMESYATFYLWRSLSYTNSD